MLACLVFMKNLVELIGYRLDDLSRELLPAHLRVVDPVIAALPRPLLALQYALLHHIVQEENY